jgi:hypothetical protein
MRIRRVIVTRESNIGELDSLQKHPNIKGVWRLPFNYVMFEFYHPVFERIYDDNMTASNAARVEEQVKVQTLAAMSEEGRILAPLYAEIRQPSDALTLLVPSNGAMYHFVGKGKGQIAWPELNCRKGWELARKTRVQMFLISAVPEALNNLDKLIADWAALLKNLGVLVRIKDLTRIGDSVTANVECFTSAGDAAMALYILLTETRSLTSVYRVSFDPLDT